MRFKYEWSHAPIEGPVSESALEVEFESEAEARDWVWREAEATVATAMDAAKGDARTLEVEIPRTFMRLTAVAE